MSIDPANRIPQATDDEELVFTIASDWYAAGIEFVINKSFVRLGKQIMYFGDITRVRHGAFNPTKYGTNFFFVFMSSKGVTMEVTFKSMTIAGDLGKKSSMFFQIEQFLQRNYGEPMIQRFHQVLVAGKQFAMGKATVSKKGISFEEKRLFRTVTFMIEWKNIKITASDTPGSVDIFDQQDRDIATTLFLENEWNGRYFAQYLQRLQNDPAMMAQLLN